MLPQRHCNVVGAAVAQAQPHDFRRCAAKNAQAVKVLVLRHEQTVALSSKVPDGQVGQSAGADLSDVQRATKNIL